MIDGTTRLVGVLGHPIAHSRSPRMQNAALRALGLPWVYVPLDVAPDRLADALRGLVALGFVGANVTIPHKQRVHELCDELAATAARARSVNTVVVRPDGTLLGESTDGPAVLDAIAAAGVTIAGATATVLGAGGAALAAAAALTDAGAAVTIAARRVAAAQDAASLLGGDVRVAAGLERGQTIVVNATPLGGASALTESPLTADELRDVRIVCDLAYRPDGQPTILDQLAARVGVGVVDGLEILARQGAASLERWTGLPAPLDVMRTAARG